MGNNSSSLQSKTSSTNNGKNNELINKLFEPNVVDTLNMNDNTNTGGSTIPVIRVSHLPQLGGFLPVANKYNNEFIANMNKNRIFNLIHETEIEQYHLNNMKKEGIFNKQETVIRGGSVLNANNTNTANAANESDVSDAMNRIKEVIANELKEQELKGGAKNRNGCGCGGNGEDNKHSNKCEFGKGKGKGKKGESSLKNRKQDNSSSSSSSSSSSASSDNEGRMNDEDSSSSNSSSNYEKEKGIKSRNTGLSVFPFNSSDMSSRHQRRKI